MASIFDIQRKPVPAATFQPLIDKYALNTLISGQDLVDIGLSNFGNWINAGELKTHFPHLEFPHDMDDLEDFCSDINTVSCQWHTDWLDKNSITPDYPKGACLEEGYIVGYDEEGAYHVRSYDEKNPSTGCFIIDAQEAKLKNLHESIELNEDDLEYLEGADFLI